MKNESLYMIIGVLLFVIGYLSAMFVYNLPSNTNLTSEVKDNCDNISLFLTADCLNNQVKSFFKYNITNINKEMNLSELKELGGVCWHYSQYYYDNINSNKFYKKMISMDIDEKSAHMVTLISDETGYCILDQSNYNCIGFTKKNETN